MRKVLGFLLVIAVILGISLLRTRKASSDGLYCRREFLMGTLVEIKTGSLGRRRAHRAVEAAFQEMKRIDVLAGRTERGDVFRLNATGETDVSPEVLELINRSVQFGDVTDGRFDITVYPLLERWSYMADSSISLPTAQELAELLPLVDYRKIEVSGGRVTLPDEGMGIDLGGIAKGYAVDRAAQMLESQGATSALIEAGGDIRVLGGKPDGSPWRIGLRHPRANRLVTTFELIDRSVCTSGDYERFFERDGTRYHHILDPAVGYPARGCVSVTVIANDATTADVLATGIFVLGPDSGLHLIDSLEDVEGIILSDKGGELQIRVSAGLEGRLTFDP